MVNIRNGGSSACMDELMFSSMHGSGTGINGYLQAMISPSFESVTGNDRIYEEVECLTPFESVPFYFFSTTGGGGIFPSEILDTNCQ